MNKYKFVLDLLAVLVVTFADGSDTIGTDKEATYNKWSVEVNVGQNKTEKPYTTGYFSSDPTKYFNFNGVEYLDLGLRYMFNTTLSGSRHFIPNTKTGLDLARRVSITIQ